MRNMLRAIIVGLGMAIAATPLVAGEVVSTPDAPAAIGPYSQAIRAGNMLFLSGQGAIDPKTNVLNIDASIEDQTRLVFENLKAVLAAGGMTTSDVVAATVFMNDLNEFTRMNAVYATYFPSAPPARQTVEVSRLPRDGKIEISLIAVKGERE
jgi:2-iminobutanoate/2-iminopropanoate deaminase